MKALLLSTLLCSAASTAALATLAPAEAAAQVVSGKDAPKAGKRYYWEVVAITAKPEIPKEIAEIAIAAVRLQVEAQRATHVQLSPTGPEVDPASAKAYEKALAKAKLAGAHRVSIEITDASEELEDMVSKPGKKRVVVRVGLHILGEWIPDKTIAFTGDGSGRIKEEIGKTLRKADRDFAWKTASESAVREAFDTSLAKLSAPPPPPPPKLKKKKS